MLIKTAHLLDFAEAAQGFVHRKNMCTGGPLHPSLKGINYTFVNYGASTHWVITKTTPWKDVETITDVSRRNGIF